METNPYCHEWLLHERRRDLGHGSWLSRFDGGLRRAAGG